MGPFTSLVQKYIQQHPKPMQKRKPHRKRKPKSAPPPPPTAPTPAEQFQKQINEALARLRRERRDAFLEGKRYTPPHRRWAVPTDGEGA